MGNTWLLTILRTYRIFFVGKEGLGPAEIRAE